MDHQLKTILRDHATANNTRVQWSMARNSPAAPDRAVYELMGGWMPSVPSSISETDISISHTVSEQPTILRDQTVTFPQSLNGEFPHYIDQRPKRSNTGHTQSWSTKTQGRLTSQTATSRMDDNLNTYFYTSSSDRSGPQQHSRSTALLNSVTHARALARFGLALEQLDHDCQRANDARVRSAEATEDLSRAWNPLAEWSHSRRHIDGSGHISAQDLDAVFLLVEDALGAIQRIKEAARRTIEWQWTVQDIEGRIKSTASHMFEICKAASPQDDLNDDDKSSAWSDENVSTAPGSDRSGSSSVRRIYEISADIRIFKDRLVESELDHQADIAELHDDFDINFMKIYVPPPRTRDFASELALSQLHSEELKKATDSHMARRTSLATRILESVNNARQIQKRWHAEQSHTGEPVLGAIDRALEDELGEVTPYMFSFANHVGHFGLRPLELVQVPYLPPEVRLLRWLKSTSQECLLERKSSRPSLGIVDIPKIRTWMDSPLPFELLAWGTGDRIQNPSRPAVSITSKTTPSSDGSRPPLHVGNTGKLPKQHHVNFHPRFVHHWNVEVTIGEPSQSEPDDSRFRRNKLYQLSPDAFETNSMV